MISFYYREVTALETNSDKKLIKILKRKGIFFERRDVKNFKNYDYYQVINGYKALFINNIETIRKIHQNIFGNIDINRYKQAFNIDVSITDKNQIFKLICKRISKKYGLKYDEIWSPGRMLREIEKIEYIHHMYINTAKYSDFIRIYKFEHELRLLLLRYTLIIEENMKNIFIKYLNNNGACANYLTDINNYNLKDGDSKTLETLKIIIDEHGNKHSKPIARKRKQNLTITYWILINELKKNQTYKAINNLNSSTSMLIFQDCVNHFTLLDIDYTDNSKTHIQRNLEKKQIQKFKILLNYLGEFRNMLAHNQPIFSFNISNIDMASFPNLSYARPKVRNLTNPVDILNAQHNMNAALMYDFQKFFGIDSYNQQNHNVNINLGTIVYIIYKIISHIDPNTKFYSELVATYSKYNILFTNHDFYTDNFDSVNDLKAKIDEFPNFDFDTILEKINNEQKHKMDIKKMKRSIEKYKKELDNISKKITIKKNMSKYSLFPANSKYTKYTGIDCSYFQKIR